MPASPLILAIDQGTTSSRAMVFAADATIHARAQQEFGQYFPRSGWVEHDPEEIWHSTLSVAREALSAVDLRAVAAIGITNQRETTIVWDRDSGMPVHRAIVWQDRRTAERCQQLKGRGVEPLFIERTGLLLDPYFSGTKIGWILDNVDGARARAEAGKLAFGTVDSWLTWRLTGGRVHATDATNAARTLLFDIHRQDWDDELLEILAVPRSMLPAVEDCAAAFGSTDPDLLGRALPIAGIAGDQQAATIGQTCFDAGMVKSTYGTGCFAVMNTGTNAVRSDNRLLTTVAYRLDGEVTYALEGSIFIAGAALQWLRDGLRVISAAPDSERLAASLGSDHGTFLVPAFTGLGAPHWDPDARGAIFGLTRDTGPEHLARAALESVCFQTHDLVVAMAADCGTPVERLRVDGGMVANDWMLQLLADVVDVEVERPAVTETTALGAAYLAGLQQGVFGSLDDLREHWQRDALFVPDMSPELRARLLRGWHSAVSRTREHRDG